MIVLMYISGFSRLIIPRPILPSIWIHNELESTYGEGFLLYMIILDVLIFIQLFGKVLFYFRVKTEFGMLVELVVGVQMNLVPFLIFLILICMFFAGVLSILGNTFGSEGKHVS